MPRRRPATLSTLLAAITELQARVAAIEAQLPPPAKKRETLDVALVDALMRAGFREVFRAAAVCEARTQTPELSRALADHLIEGPHSMGKALERLARLGRVERLRADGRGARWRVRRGLPGDGGDSCDTGCHSAGESRP